VIAVDLFLPIGAEFATFQRVKGSADRVIAIHDNNVGWEQLKRLPSEQKKRKGEKLFFCYIGAHTY